MSHSGHSLARGRLRLAWAPGTAPARETRALLWLRAILITLWCLSTSLVARIGAAVSLLPVIWRRAPLGSRRRPARRQARVIRFPVVQRSIHR